MSVSSYVLIEPVNNGEPRNASCGKIGMTISSMLIGFVLGCVVFSIGGGEQHLTIQEPATQMAWSSFQPGTLATSRISPLFAMPTFASTVRFQPFRNQPHVIARAYNPGQAPVQNVQNRPRQHQGKESSFEETEWLHEREAEEQAAAAALAIATAHRAEAVVETTYPINIFVHSDKSHQYGVEGSDYKKGTSKFAYMENKIHHALENSFKTVNSVDVRLTVEGHKPKTYRLETAVKFVGYHKEGTVVVSKPKHAQSSFLEAVDHMHDTLKRNLVKEKEKHMAKLKHQRKDISKQGESDMELPVQDEFADVEAKYGADA
jgi:ribosomal subunit interface protein